MLRLSDCLGAEVTDGTGRRLGRLADLEVTLEQSYPVVEAVVIRAAHGRRDVVPWDRVSVFEPTGVVVRDAAPGAAAAPGGETLRLARDVLDAQIVDVAGQRVRRVSDVDLARTERGLRAVAVDVGWAAIGRRLGLSRRGATAHRNLVDWTDLHLGSPRGHELQLRTTSAALHRLSPGELSELVARLPPQRAAQALHAVEEDRAAAALSVARPRLGGQLVSALPHHGAARLLAAMPVDDAVAILRHLEGDRRETLLAGVPPARASKLRRLLAYPTGTAGGLMTTDIRTAGVNEPLADVVGRLAADPPALEGLFTVLVVDDAGRLAGVLPPSALITGRDEPVEVAAVRPDTPLDEVAELFARHDIVAVPVVDDERRPVGAVAVDDVLEELLAERLPQHRRRYRRPFRTRRAAA